MRRVEHPGLIASLGAGVLGDGRPYICMPRLRGETLARRLTRGRLPVETAVALFDVMARAVAALHAGRVDPPGRPSRRTCSSTSRRARSPRSARSCSTSASPATWPTARRPRRWPDSCAGHPRTWRRSASSARPPTRARTSTSWASPLYMMLVGKMPVGRRGERVCASVAGPSRGRRGFAARRARHRRPARALHTRPRRARRTADAFADAVQLALRHPVEEGRTTGSVSVAVRSDAASPDRASPSGSRWGWGLAAAAALLVTAVAVRPPARSAGSTSQPEPALPTATAPPAPPPSSSHRPSLQLPSSRHRARRPRTPPTAPRRSQRSRRRARPRRAPRRPTRRNALQHSHPLRPRDVRFRGDPRRVSERYYLDRK